MFGVAGAVGEVPPRGLGGTVEVVGTGAVRVAGAVVFGVNSMGPLVVVMEAMMAAATVGSGPRPTSMASKLPYPVITNRCKKGSMPIGSWRWAKYTLVRVPLRAV
jgi:hypothetical protein